MYRQHRLLMPIFGSSLREMFENRK